MTASHRSILVIALLAASYAALAILVRNSYYQLILTMVLVWATMGLSWNLFSGYTGLISFGHAAFFGIGAYVAVLGQIKLGITPWISIPLATVLGGLAGLVVGLPTFRLRGHYFALAMLAYPMALLYVFEWLGYSEITIPMERERPTVYMQFSDPRTYTFLALTLLVGLMVLTLSIERSRFGRALLAIKQNEAAAEAAGIDTLRWKLRALCLSAAIAGGIGAFYAVILLVVTPGSVFGLLISAQALTVAMFGGVGSVWGPVIGAIVLVPLSEVLHAQFGSWLPGIQGVVYGCAMIIVILVAPEGIFWKVRKAFLDGKITLLAPPVRTAGNNDFEIVDSVEVPHLVSSIGSEVILDVQGVSKSFGGISAVQGVSFAVSRGEVLGIIGPNGAGKTTLFNLLNGFVRPDRGEVRLFGDDVAGRKPHVLCQAGVGRTFQVTRPFSHMTLADNVLIGAFVHAKDHIEAQRFAQEALARVGLSDSANRLAGDLTTHDLRLMELARALAGRPRILLMDEPLAGLGYGEVDEVIDLVRRLAEEGITIVIIEHTMQAMVRLVDRFIVLDQGRVLLEGVPEAVTRDPRVVEAYLGKKWRTAIHA